MGGWGGCSRFLRKCSPLGGNVLTHFRHHPLISSGNNDPFCAPIGCVLGPGINPSSCRCWVQSVVDPQHGANPLFKGFWGVSNQLRPWMQYRSHTLKWTKNYCKDLKIRSTVFFGGWGDAKLQYRHPLTSAKCLHFYCFSARYSSADNNPGQKPSPAVWPNPLSSVLPATPSPPPHSVFPAPAPSSQVQKQLELVNRLSANWGWKILYQSQWSGGMEQLREEGGRLAWMEDEGTWGQMQSAQVQWIQFSILSAIHFS